MREHRQRPAPPTLKAPARDVCRACHQRSLCLARVLGGEVPLAELEAAVRHPPPVRRGEVLVAAGARFDRLRMLRTGLLKTQTTDHTGNVRVTGFTLPGDLAGLEAVAAGRHDEALIALETSSVCELPYEALLALARRQPALQEELLARMSGEVLRTRRLLRLFGRRTAAERVAAVLLGMAARQAGRGLSAHCLRLGMSGRELASYLGLAPATLSRVLRRLERDGLLTLGDGEVILRDAAGLAALAGELAPAPGLAGMTGPAGPRARGTSAAAPRFPRPARRNRG